MNKHLREKAPPLMQMVCLCLCFAACGQQEDERKTPTVPQQAESLSLEDLSNQTFISPCRPNKTYNRSDLEAITFQKKGIERVWSNFNGLTCTKEKKRATYTYSLTTSDNAVTSTIDGWNASIYSYKSIMLAPNSALIAKNFNDKRAYGYSNWRAGMAKSVIARRFTSKDKAKPKKGEVQTITLKIDNGILYIARYENNKAVATSPLIFQSSHASQN